MIRADSINTTSRRGFLTKGAATVAGGAAMLAAAPAFAANSDAEVIAAGAKFEALLTEYLPGRLEWGRRHRAGKAEVSAKFGDDYASPSWSKPFSGTSPAQKFLSLVVERNGTRRISDAQGVLYDKMEPLADLIREADVESLAGLRSKTLVTLWDCLPIGAFHEGCLHFEDENLRSLFNGAVAVTGLSKFVSSFCERLENDAAEEV